MEIVKNSLKLSGAAVLLGAAGFTGAYGAESFAAAAAAPGDYAREHDVSKSCDSSISDHVTRMASASDKSYMAECGGVSPANIDRLMVLHEDIDESSYFAMNALLLGGGSAALAISGVRGLRSQPGTRRERIRI
ncbi:MAG TPA: hypothetical protein VF575_00870 [Candidatus Saccharimonadales bacterium]|jgi:hypothetical protein